MSRRPVAVLLTAIVASTALALAGCAATADETAEAPEVGACHQLDRPEHFTAVSDPSTPVACSAEHTTETYFVGDLTDSVRLGGRYPAVQERGEIAEAACPGELVREYVGADPRQALYGVWTIAFLPTEAAWAAGERWVRCDLALVVDEAGAFEPVQVTISLRDAAASDDADLLLRCYGGNGTVAGGAEVEIDVALDVRCSDGHDARDVNQWIPITEALLVPATLEQLCAPWIAEWAASQSVGQAAASAVVVTERNGSLTARCVAVEAGADG